MKKLFGNNSGFINKVVRRIATVKFVTIVALILAVTAFGGWQYNNMTSKDRIFWGMVDNSLQTTSFSKKSLVKSGGQSAEQITDVFASPKQQVYSQTHFEQTGADEASAVTENIGTATQDYVRYISITTNQRNTEGKEYDFSNILNVWGSSVVQDETQSTGQLFSQSVLGVIPTGNLSASQRHHLVKLLKDSKAYTFTANKPSREFPFGRPNYTYNVVIDPVGYITALKEFGRDIGLTQLESINPNDYKSSAKMQFQVSVDGWSHQATKIVQSSGGKSETISAHNVRKPLQQLPKDTIDIDELQTRLQSVE